jgi:hypothetical protein
MAALHVLGDVVKAGHRIEYAYDFGGGACPPEDTGGAPGFAELKALLAGPPSPERDEIRAWSGDYDPPSPV